MAHTSQASVLGCLSWLQPIKCNLARICEKNVDQASDLTGSVLTLCWQSLLSIQILWQSPLTAWQVAEHKNAPSTHRVRSPVPTGQKKSCLWTQIRRSFFQVLPHSSEVTFARGSAYSIQQILAPDDLLVAIPEECMSPPGLKPSSVQRLCKPLHHGATLSVDKGPQPYPTQWLILLCASLKLTSSACN